MQEDGITKLGSLRAKLFSTPFNEKVVCTIFSLVALIVLLSIWYSYSQLGAENVVHIFAEPPSARERWSSCSRFSASPRKNSFAERSEPRCS